MHFRGCSGEPNRLVRSGEPLEVEAVVDNRGRREQRVRARVALAQDQGEASGPVVVRELTVPPRSHQRLKVALGQATGRASLG